ncbi:2-amino-4-hydroxy-6-hydroxymethyldihydropteridine diphosphokinase [Methylohalobius crimeensis]|uniref:2-amino-4-hydroxy-6- hydroxymethyldihydropteridine diphosphokinase n=1 Tax=Methylohalobius crimeensis TaxID=244365 RepID=UPI0003B5F860|nr:2-amino-4-hydroxy-6-hydroxymethyldihydropteridine diphosphokinase [Methylohalobius crimeensis]
MTKAGGLVYIGMGSNLDHPVAQVKQARREVAALDGVREEEFSSLYRSFPMGPPDQPAYINAVMAVDTERPPHDLLTALQNIELAHGRLRTGERWGPRTLDLDLLLYGRCCMRSETLTLPHYGLPDRPFVLYPLAEIAPLDLLIPGRGTLGELLRRCPRDGLECLEVDDD